MLIPAFRLDLGNKGIDVDNFGKSGEDLEALNKKLFLSDKSIPVRTLVNDNYFVTIIKDGNKVWDFSALFHDRRSSETRRVNLYHDKVVNLPLPSSIDNEAIFSVIDGEKTLQWMEFLSEKGIKIRGDVNVIDSQDYVMLICKLR